MSRSPFTERNPQRIAVVGGGPAAHRFAEAILSAQDHHVRLEVFADEPHMPYDRVQLSKALAADVDLTLGAGSIWADPRVTLHTGCKVREIDPEQRTLRTDPPAGSGTKGEVFGWDELVLATGSDAARLNIPGAQRAFVYRTLEDVAAIRAEVERLRSKLGRTPLAAVVGGGLLGLEAAGGLQELGAEATVVHSRGWLMNAQLDQGAGQALNALISQRGVQLRMGERPSGITLNKKTNEVSAVEFKDSPDLPADMVVVSTGIRARDRLAFNAGIHTAPHGGVVISSSCRTSAPHVWAIGEVANYDGECVGLVAPANAMAEIVADRLAGGASTFAGFDTATKLKLSGVDVASFGDAYGTAENCLEIVYADPARGLYQKIVTTADAKTLLGGVFVGDATPYQSLRPLLERELPTEPGVYLSAAGGQAPDTELPDDAELCSCNGVSFGDVREAVSCGVHDITELKTCTRAGTQCGSCLPMLKKTMDQELSKAGVAVSKALCEHFELSRAELFEAVQALNLNSWDAVLERFGTGLGCDICKPVVASVLATQQHDYVLDDGRGGLQDTNDRALANMQRNGTYSVVPRMPGGEITPDKLIVIGEVAKKYGLYTKLTGALRITMLGARLDQLPEIWKDLVDAGFESGQAYGKALRNVKSCLGSTWCRYGVLDSVGMGIRLELRYRGLRSPHKFKMGVSGCARECAEARAKDVGVIATSDGWNLYVGGNGGANPVHGELLAQGLDDETLIAYIDRYLMYYIRTADRLQRTARWQEELDGKIDHVRNVVVEDSLGIAADLETAMSEHVETYQDEWAATLKDPDRLARFRGFVNDVEVDDSIRWVAERDQHRPATPEEIAEGLGETIPPALANTPTGSASTATGPAQTPTMLAGPSLRVGPPSTV
ncbi:nitrite reductase large subunit NirB [Kocuria sp.]|uniref:nitrite reductase large subunit NirB n=1 Tax=Kocuria sp. TaxID=1871328 RepID=UPI0026DF246E|nr:nitrite reductase large subunit NirB [Kocuria sp.]MDO5619099.1 nitrite reductase large subunit NirB [Kocuria sp.]